MTLRAGHAHGVADAAGFLSVSLRPPSGEFALWFGPLPLYENSGAFRPQDLDCQASIGTESEWLENAGLRPRNPTDTVGRMSDSIRLTSLAKTAG
jgi:hypothetical protein